MLQLPFAVIILELAFTLIAVSLVHRTVRDSSAVSSFVSVIFQVKLHPTVQNGICAGI